MSGRPKLPDNIKQDLSIYLAPDEKILKSINIASGKFETTGQIWLVLTDKSILFHTKRHEKDPVVALIARNNIEEIDYFQKQSEIVLTFYPKKNRSNASRLTFPIASKAELEDFCEDLADLINFRLENKNGVKVYPKAPVEKQPVQATPSGEAKKPEKAEKTVKPEKPAKAAQATKTKQKDSRPKKVAGVKIFTRNNSSKSASPQSSENGAFSIKPGFIIASTVVSIIVAFIWFKFFHLLTHKN
jgi:hypothetical protein